MPLFCWVIIYLTCIVIHHTKPMSVGIHHAKGFWDMLIYKTYTRCLKSYTNFWTPCSTTSALPRSDRACNCTFRQINLGIKVRGPGDDESAMAVSN